LPQPQTKRQGQERGIVIRMLLGWKGDLLAVELSVTSTAPGEAVLLDLPSGLAGGSLRGDVSSSRLLSSLSLSVLVVSIVKQLCSYRLLMKKSLKTL